MKGAFWKTLIIAVIIAVAGYFLKDKIPALFEWIKALFGKKATTITTNTSSTTPVAAVKLEPVALEEN
jgi:hypothetical protein